MIRIGIAVLVLLLLPQEITRYAGERALRRMRGSTAADSVRTYPGDWRPLTMAAEASFAKGDFARAASLYERANALGERPDVDVNLALTLARLGEKKRATATLERAFVLAPGFRRLLEQQKLLVPRPANANDASDARPELVQHELR